ncbi:MAG TPA: hypothetical protein PLN21_17870 [Gemmatales bacterium]|nr:hypothetical protein [Gemmatales bacterium]
MKQMPAYSRFLFATVIAMVILVPLVWSSSDQQQEKATPGLADAVKQLQQQVASLKTQVAAIQTPRIIAAGTATFTMGAVQDNATNVRVKLSAEVAAKLGEDYIVLLTHRFPTGGFPFFVPYWKKASDGFDATLIDVSIGPNSSTSYMYNKNKTFLIDWVVVKK